MSTDLYLKAAEELRRNAGQWHVYESAGNCVVQAGPGGGKTKAITIKIARLLSETIRRPRRLACITYSNACVGELRARLKKLGVADDERLLLSTVHSFCLTELVLPYARLAGLKVPEPLAVASPSRSQELFGKAYGEVLGGLAPGWFRLECDKLRRTVLDRAGHEWDAASQRETAVVEAYEALLLENGLIDFDGLVLAGLELVEKHEWVRRAIKAKYPVLVIDEYQDLGVPPHRMVVALMKQAGIRIHSSGRSGPIDLRVYGSETELADGYGKIARRRTNTVKTQLSMRGPDHRCVKDLTLEPRRFSVARRPSGGDQDL
jgi:ATP-dependent DNA helicase Rep/DNA helicase-2/ATP-dependent DNA helicase PcrA